MAETQAIEELAAAIEANLLARSGSDLSPPEHLIMRQAATAAAFLAHAQTVLEERPEDRVALATVSRLSANLLASMPTLTAILGDLAGTALAGVVGAEAAHGERLLAGIHTRGGAWCEPRSGRPTSPPNSAGSLGTRSRPAAR